MYLLRNTRRYKPRDCTRRIHRLEALKYSKILAFSYLHEHFSQLKKKRWVTFSESNRREEYLDLEGRGEKDRGEST
jgi:hypothetical protein